MVPDGNSVAKPGLSSAMRIPSARNTVFMVVLSRGRMAFAPGFVGSRPEKRRKR